MRFKSYALMRITIKAWEINALNQELGTEVWVTQKWI